MKVKNEHRSKFSSLSNWKEAMIILHFHYLDWNANILKFIFEFANYPFFLIHLEWKRQMRSYTRSRSSLEPYPIADQNGQNL